MSPASLDRALSLLDSTLLLDRAVLYDRALLLDRALLNRALLLDRALLLFARTRCHRPALERVVTAYSRLGEHGACWLVLAGAGTLLDRRPAARERWRRAARVVVAAHGLNYAVKLAVRRRRPELDGLPPLTPTVSRLSFPSAHCTTSFAAARALSGLMPAAPLYAAAAAFALSRPYLGVHYPSDVIAGALLGTLVAKAWPDAAPGPPSDGRPGAPR